MAEKPDTENVIFRFGLLVHPVVFPVSAVTIVAFVVTALLFPSGFSQAITAAQSTLATNFSWFYVLAMNVFLGFVILVLLGRFGTIRLGGSDARPEFSRLSWFAMLFSAGMGIGLIFYGVAEPILHYTTPPRGMSGTLAAASQAELAEQAMVYTFYHWGFHAWGVYALVGLALAFFAFNKGLPFSLRSAFYPVLGKRIYGPIGSIVDITAVVATLFGVATSLGLGVQQINAGLHHVAGVGQSALVQVILIAIITAVATISVATGVKKGIKLLSELNLVLASILMVFVVILGPTVLLLDTLIQNLGAYLHQLPRVALETEAYDDRNWQQGWTIFFWAWWIGWSPFVGMFIARISRGRTVREFLLGVLIVPSIITFLWLTVFGNTALNIELNGGGGLAGPVADDVAVALFVFLERFPFAMVTSFLGVLVVVTFFVTSSDSGSLVIDIIAAGGRTDAPAKQRIFWSVLEGFVAAVLLLFGGLQALQTAAIVTGFPFAIVLLIMCYSLWRGFCEHQDNSST